MHGFDIETLVDFQPPGYRCENCLSLWSRDYFKDLKDRSCRYCGVKYVSDSSTPGASISEYLRKEGFAIEFTDPLSHARDLAKIARNIALRENPPDPEYWEYPYMKALLQAFAVAQSFVHFVTFGSLPDFMIGVMKLAAQRIHVNGVVSSPGGSSLSRVLKSVNEDKAEASKLKLKVLASEVEDLPHQKLVVVDGLFAFKGSANLHHQAWRKAEDKKENIEVVTDIQEVVRLNNTYFSPAWRPHKSGAGVGGLQEYEAGVRISMYMGPFPWDDFDLEL